MKTVRSRLLWGNTVRILGLIAAWLASLFFLLLSGLAGLSAMFVGGFGAAAAAQGYPQAQLNLGAMYSKGEGGLKKNVAEARRLYELASKGDDLPTKAIAKKNLAALDWNEAHGFKN